MNSNSDAPIADLSQAHDKSRASLKKRGMASLAHLAISIAVAACAFALVFFLWYPGPFWKMGGGQGLFFLVVSVDIVIGPIITLAIFNPSKTRKALTIDLTVVALLQLAALSYGLLKIADARPVFMVYNVGQIAMIRNADLSSDDLAKAEKPEFRQVPWDGPKLIATRRATPEERSALIDSALAGRDVAVQPKFYVPYQDEIPSALAHAKDISTLKERNKSKDSEIDALVKNLGRDPKELVFLPTIARGDWVAILDAKTAEVLDYWPLNGF